MASGIVVVKQWHIMIVFRRGEFIGIRQPGLHFLMPFWYRGRIVNLQKQDLNLVPLDADAYANRAIAYAILGRDELAERDLLQALKLGFDQSLLEEIIQEAKKDFTNRRLRVM